MRIITGTVVSTTLQWLPALSNIIPPDKRRQQASLRDYQKVVQNSNIPLHHDLQLPSISRLKSRRPHIVSAKHLHESGFDARMAWKIAWLETNTSSLLFNTHTCRSEGFLLPRKVWCNFNRLRTEHGRCNEMLFKWRIIDDPSCSCGEPNQTTLQTTYS